MIDTKSNTDAAQLQGVNHSADEKPIHTHFTPPPLVNQGQMPTPRIYEGKEYYGAADVAKILGVDRTAVLYWHNKGLFTADVRAHDGRYLYTVERVMQLKSVYHSKWMRGGYEPSPSTMETNTMTIKGKSYTDNFPDELTELKRFFSVGAAKNDPPVGWNKPENQKTLADAAQDDKYIGFDTCGHGKGEDYALIDFDHVTDLSGKFLYPVAEAWLIWILQQFRGGYCERSVSGHGFHILCKPTPGKFKTLSGGRKASLIFDKEAGAKIEIFYASKGRYCLLTGDVYRKTINERLIGSGERADDVLATLLSYIEKKNTMPGFIQGLIEYEKRCAAVRVDDNEPAQDAAANTAPATADNGAEAAEPVTGNGIDLTKHGYNETPARIPGEPAEAITHVDTPEYNLFRAKRMLDAIPPAELLDSDWLAVNSAAKNIGLPYAVVDEFNRRDPKRYNEEGNKKRCDSCTDPGFGIETLHGIAKRFGYSEKDSVREWHDLRGDRKPTNPAKTDVNHSVRAEEPGIDEVFADDADLAQKLKEWQEVNGTIAPAVLPNIKTAVEFVNGLTPENITADIAGNPATIHRLAIVSAYLGVGAAEKFFSALKEAKELAQNRLVEADKVTAPLTDDERINLSALINGVNIKSLRGDIERQKKDVLKAHKEFQKKEGQRKAREEAKAKQEAQLMKMDNARERLQKLKALPPSTERDSTIIETIKELCSWRYDKHDNPIKVEATQDNIDLIFTNDPNLDGLFAYDEFVTAVVYQKAPYWEDKQVGEEWTDADDDRLQTYLQRTYTEFKDEKLILRNVTDYSRARKFHVIRDYIRSLPAWDGKPRAETLFIDWLAVDDTPFARAVTLNWLIAALARIFNPGCRYRYVPVLVGEQGIGKDFVFQRLGGKWHSAISDSLDDSHALDALIVSWLAVFEEMNAANKASVNAVKSFISRNEDTRREPFGRRATKRKRQSVYAVTTNDDKFLSDLTGNTRFLVLQCHGTIGKPIKIVRGEALTDDNTVAQIWAEVFARYSELFKDGFDEAKLILPDDITKQAAEIAELYVRDDGSANIIKTFVDTKILPPVIWDLLNREQRRQFMKEQSLTIEMDELSALFRGSGRITAARQAEFNAAIAENRDFCLRVTRRNKNIGDFTTFLKMFGTVYRQHICAAEVLEEAFDKTDKRRQPAKIHEMLKRLDGWHMGKRIPRDPRYGNQRIVYYRDEDNNPASVDNKDDNETAQDETRADDAVNTAPADEWQGEPVDPADVPFDIEPQPDPNEPVILPDDDDNPF